jgi:hypothetical protein
MVDSPSNLSTPRKRYVDEPDTPLWLRMRHDPDAGSTGAIFDPTDYGQPLSPPICRSPGSPRTPICKRQRLENERELCRIAEARATAVKAWRQERAAEGRERDSMHQDDPFVLEIQREYRERSAMDREDFWLERYLISIMD